jgi:glycosyltransferase involved in cell wall biosynthesis
MESNHSQNSAQRRTILIITYYFFPCSHPVLENVFAKELAKKLNIIWLFQGDITKGKIQKWHNSLVFLSNKYVGNSVQNKILNQIFGFKKYFSIVTLLLKYSIDIIVIRDMPFKLILFAPLSRLLKFKLYFQYSAPLGDIDVAYYKASKKLYKHWYLFKGLYQKALIKIALNAADIVFPITEYHKQKLSIYKNPQKFVPLTMGIDEDWIFSKTDELAHIKEIKKENFVLVYFGSLNLVRNPKFILKVFAEVLKDQKNCFLFLIGGTSKNSELKELKNFCDTAELSENTIFFGRMNRKYLKDHLQYCDLSISAIPPTDHYRISSPTKLYESLGNGIPVIANRGIYEQESVIRNSQGGVLVEYKIKSFADAIVSLLKNKQLREKMAQYGKAYVIENYSYRHISEKIYPYFL